MVRFWDTSAVVPLAFEEPATPAVRSVLEQDPAMIVWWGTRIEFASALARRLRDSGAAAASGKPARDILEALAREWSEVLPSATLRRRAERLLAVHAIRSADALQLAAALTWTKDQPQGRAFVCLDERLRDAAAREGFDLLPLA